MKDAHVQSAKNAWQDDDLVADRNHWRLALEEPRRALDIEPRNAEAQQQVAEYKHRLSELVVER